MNLKNKTALITGGTHGIGAATASMLAEDGADICLVARNPADDKLREQIKSLRKLS